MIVNLEILQVKITQNISHDLDPYYIPVFPICTTRQQRRNYVLLNVTHTRENISLMFYLHVFFLK